MHTVANNNVSENINQICIEKTKKKSYTSILSSALSYKKRKNHNDAGNRFYYSVGNLNFLFEPDLKVENISYSTVNKVPHAPEWCAGIISVRGIIIPVINMHILLKDKLRKSSFSYKQIKKPYLLMIEHRNHDPIILQIDKLPNIINIKDYTYSEKEKDSPNWQGKTWENSTSKLLEIDHDLFLDTIKA